MAISQSYQTRLFDDVLKPYLEKGFKRRGARGIYKIENGLVYVISFQYGRLNNVYLHFFVNSIANVFTEIFHSNEFGKRLQGTEYGRKFWYVENDEQYEEAKFEVSRAIKEIACPFFLKIDSIERLYFHYLVQFQYTLLPFSAALLSAQIGENSESIKYCERSISDIESDDEFDIRNSDADKQTYSYLVELKDALNNGTAKTLIQSWEDQIKQKYKLIESTL